MNANLEMTIKHVCEKYSLTDEYEKLDEGLESIRSKGIRIAFLGPVKSGKSTLINALLGDENILPVQETPTTGCITEIRNGPELQYRVFTGEPDNAKEVSREIAHEYIVGKLPADKVEVQTTSLGMLDDGVFIVDTPGVRSTVKSHDLITQEYLPEVDQAFFVMSAEHGAPQASALEFIRDDISDLDLSKLLFVVTKADLYIDPEDQTRILAQFRKDLSRVVENPRVFMVSGLRALEDSSKSSENPGNLGTITSLISEEMQSRRERIIEDKVRKLLKSTAKQLISILEAMKDESSTDTSNLETESKELKQEITKLEKMMTELKRNFRDLRKKGYEIADSTARELSDSLVAQYRDDGSLSMTELEKTIGVFQQTIRSSVSNGLKEIEGLEDIVVHCGFNNVLGEVSNLNDMISIVDILATFALVALVVPGAAPGVELGEGLAGGAYTFLEMLFGGDDDDKKSRTSPKQILGFVLKLNPIHTVSEKLIKPLVFEKRSFTKFRRKLHRYISEYFIGVENMLNDVLENKVILPIRNKESALRNILEAKKSKVDNYQEFVIGISDDIRSLKREVE